MCPKGWFSKIGSQMQNNCAFWDKNTKFGTVYRKSYHHQIWILGHHRFDPKFLIFVLNYLPWVSFRLITFVFKHSKVIVGIYFIAVCYQLQSILMFHSETRFFDTLRSHLLQHNLWHLIHLQIGMADKIGKDCYNKSKILHSKKYFLIIRESILSISCITLNLKFTS